jgi:hypothetical protein
VAVCVGLRDGHLGTLVPLPRRFSRVVWIFLGHGSMDSVYYTHIGAQREGVPGLPDNLIHDFYGVGSSVSMIAVTAVCSSAFLELLPPLLANSSSRLIPLNLSATSSTHSSSQTPTAPPNLPTHYIFHVFHTDYLLAVENQEKYVSPSLRVYCHTALQSAFPRGFYVQEPARQPLSISVTALEQLLTGCRPCCSQRNPCEPSFLRLTGR